MRIGSDRILQSLLDRFRERSFNLKSGSMCFIVRLDGLSCYVRLALKASASISADTVRKKHKNTLPWIQLCV